MTTDHGRQRFIGDQTSPQQQRLYASNRNKRRRIRVIPEWLEKNALPVGAEPRPPHSVNDPGKLEAFLAYIFGSIAIDTTSTTDFFFSCFDWKFWDILTKSSNILTLHVTNQSFKATVSFRSDWSGLTCLVQLLTWLRVLECHNFWNTERWHVVFELIF